MHNHVLVLVGQVMGCGESLSFFLMRQPLASTTVQRHLQRRIDQMSWRKFRFAQENRHLGKGRRLGLSVVFLWFFFGGILHFTATAAEARIVPPFIPWPVAAVLITGALELLGAFGILLPRSRRAAGVGLFCLILAVTPVHIYMLERPELFHVPIWALWLRLPLQLALLALILWSVRPPRDPDDGI
jgi:uncharacterized membrane protein